MASNNHNTYNSSNLCVSVSTLIYVHPPNHHFFLISLRSLHSSLFRFAVNFRWTTCLFIHFRSFRPSFIFHMSHSNYLPMFLQKATIWQFSLTPFGSNNSGYMILPNYAQDKPKIIRFYSKYISILSTQQRKL